MLVHLATLAASATFLASRLGMGRLKQLGYWLGLDWGLPLLLPLCHQLDLSPPGVVLQLCYSPVLGSP